jgi:gamma-glutamylcyclotransferase
VSENIFAYGSNMCSGRFRDYSVSPEGPGEPALLRGYRLRFNKRSQRDDSGKANVEPHAESEVWGVVYLIPDDDLPVLDQGEGHGYTREKKMVCRANGRSLEAWIYVAAYPSTEAGLRPYAWYKRFLVEGAREHGLPGNYIEALQAIEADEDPDPRRDQEKRALNCHGGESRGS